MLPNNRRIAKNTVMLYIRTFITMIVALYTSRIMLQALGVDDFGINNVVAGIVAMSSLITGAVSSAISRFITYALGEGDKERMKMIFSTSINVMLLISVISVIALELIGGWFLNMQAEIPDGRMTAANWLLQCTIAVLVINLISSPYNATIVAHEHMSVYAYFSIIEVVLKLGVCFAIMAFGGDRLIMLAVLNVVVAIAIRIFYSWYCKRHFEEARYDCRLFDKSFLREMSQFTGWYMVGNAVWVFNTQGINMLINVFFGVTVNAARGIASSVNAAINSFVNSFTVAFIPQITKSYAAGDKERMFFLVFKGTKFTWFLMFLFIIPVFWEADTILILWLGKVPDHAVVFTRLSLFECWSMVFSFALHNAILASGQLKRVQMQISIYTALIFPFTWVAFKLGTPAWFSCIIFVFFNTTAKVFTLIELKRIMDFPVIRFLKDCLLPCTMVTIIAFALPGLLVYMIPQSLCRFMIVFPLAVLWTLLCEYIIGLNSEEKNLVILVAKNLKNKYISK